MNKRDIDLETAVLLDIPVHKIEPITSVFLNRVARAIATNVPVVLVNFGQFSLRLTTGFSPNNRATVRKQGVTFRKSRTMKRLIEAQQSLSEVSMTNNEGMEKYAVVEDVDEQLEKKAGRGCPACGAKPEVHGKTLVCPKHGSEPFESK